MAAVGGDNIAVSIALKSWYSGIHRVYHSQTLSCFSSCSCPSSTDSPAPDAGLLRRQYSPHRVQCCTEQAAATFPKPTPSTALNMSAFPAPRCLRTSYIQGYPEWGILGHIPSHSRALLGALIYTQDCLLHPSDIFHASLLLATY